MIERVCGLNELELNLKNGNQNSELKKEMLNRKSKGTFEFQNVFEYEIKKLKEKYNDN